MRKTLTALITTATLGMTALAANASACTQWDTTWMQLRQSNGYIVGLPSQSGSTVSGRTNLSAFGSNWQRYIGGGYISGWTYQNRFTATIWWDNHSAGNYDGTIDGNGHISGYTSDRYNSSSTASFTSIGNARCLY
jgi:hypothetical protein